MDGGQLTAIIIVAIVMIASILRAKHRGVRPYQGDDQTRVENQRLREEVGDLKERLKVLERITVDKENSLSREIESLRDR
jgi:hypothetical protein